MYNNNIGRHNKFVGYVPSSLVQQQCGNGTRGDLGSDLGQMQVHRLDVASRQDEPGALALLWTNSTEYIGRGGALVMWCARP